mmetsp:Transcript_39019/g.93432  ORF Transcript_39019/g.93432 Transcript_39019/m.93432 type:complete len:310 (+) Transcript_39019:134-1063(+)
MAGIGARRLKFRSRLSKREQQQGGPNKHDAPRTTKAKALSSSGFIERRSGGSPNESRSPGGLRSLGSQSTDARNSPPSSPEDSARGAAQTKHRSFLCNALGPPGLDFEEDDEKEQWKRSFSLRKLREEGQIVEPRRTRSEPENQRPRLMLGSNRDQSAPPSALRRVSSFRRVKKEEITVDEEEAQPGCHLFGTFHRDDGESESPKKKEKAVRFAAAPSLQGSAAKARLVGATAVLVAANRMNNRSRTEGEDYHESSLHMGQSCNSFNVDEDVSGVFCDPAFFSEVKHEVGYMLGYKPEEVEAEKKLMWM